eukprot:352984-Chlamydomonas_euryale.AAC.2
MVTHTDSTMTATSRGSASSIPMLCACPHLESGTAVCMPTPRMHAHTSNACPHLEIRTALCLGWAADGKAHGQHDDGHHQPQQQQHCQRR